MTKLLGCVVVLLLVAFVGAADANLISNFNFDSEQVLYTDRVKADDTNTHNEWYARGGTNTGWHIVNDSSSFDGTYYARHFDHNEILVQGFTTGIGSYTLDFDYAYESGFGGPWASVEIRGLNGTENIYIHDPAGAYSVGDTIFQGNLEIQEGWSTFSDVFSIAADYDVIALVIYSGAFQSGVEPAPGLRGVDNVRVNPVPEPATMFLLGAGLIGLAGLRRQFRK